MYICVCAHSYTYSFAAIFVADFSPGSRTDHHSSKDHLTGHKERLAQMIVGG